MKNIILLVVLLMTGSLAQAQFKKDGTPDMRYRENQQIIWQQLFNAHKSWHRIPKELRTKWHTRGRKLSH